MGCKPKPKCKQTSRSGRSNLEDNDWCNMDELEETGREQFFQHYGKSQLPVRNIILKTEPHIEIGAENYLFKCLQPNIRGFLKSNEKYLFLCTTCNNRKVGDGDFYGKRFIVGFIKKKQGKDMDGYYAVLGNTFLAPFDEDLEYSSLGFNRSRGMQCFDKNDTKKILRYVKAHKNIRRKVFENMIELEDEARERDIELPIDDVCLGKKCNFRENCLRREYE